MKGVSSWSYRPYAPFFHDAGRPYICRLAPGKTTLGVEWLGEKGEEAEVSLQRDGEEGYTPVLRTVDSACLLTGLAEDAEYRVLVRQRGSSSRVRRVRTGEAVGTVVNYLHPEDDAYAFSGRSLCSPSLLRAPDGALLASMDVYAAGAPQDLTLVFRSEDEGATWRYACELFPCFWGKLFAHRGNVYMLACSTEYGDLLISRSPDCGRSFPTPTVLLRGSCKCAVAGVHKNPQPLVEHAGRLWGTLEWGAWAEGYHAAMVMSASADADLTDPASWAFTPPVRYDGSWPGVAQGPSAGTIEGALAVGPEGALWNIMRYDMTRCTPNWGLALAYRVDTDDPEAPLRFDHTVPFPGNHSKFCIQKDEADGMYYSIVSRITDPRSPRARNLLSLLRSPDLRSWEVAADLIDRREEDPALVGFQYVDFRIEGDDILFLCRTAMNGAANFHDANYSTFHRLRNFRSLGR